MRTKRAKAIRRARQAEAPPQQRNAAGKQLLTFTRKFLLAAALTIIPISLIPEAWFGPLNRFTALLVGDVLRAWTLHPVVRESAINLGGFRVNVIAECSAVHLVALLAAFIFAFPATRKEKWIGVGAGTVLLFSVNILRIALVTVIGLQFPTRFEAAHVYFGQLGMLVATMTACLMWCRWTSGPGQTEGPIGFLIRFLIFSILPFFLWVPLNRIYIGTIDGFISWLFSLVSLRLVIPHTHELYYQTFSLIALGGLLMAVRGVGLGIRARWMILGAVILTLFQIALRLCNLWISAFQIGWIAPVSQVVYNLCVYAVPMVVALRLFMQVRMQRDMVVRRSPGDVRGPFSRS